MVPWAIVGLKNHIVANEKFIKVVFFIREMFLLIINREDKMPKKTTEIVRNLKWGGRSISPDWNMINHNIKAPEDTAALARVIIGVVIVVSSSEE